MHFVVSAAIQSFFICQDKAFSLLFTKTEDVDYSK